MCLNTVLTTECYERVPDVSNHFSFFAGCFKINLTYWKKIFQQKLFSGFYRLEGLFVTICLYNMHL